MITRRSMFAKIGAALAALPFIGRKSEALTPKFEPNPLFIVKVIKKPHPINKNDRVHLYEVSSLDEKMLGAFITLEDFVRPLTATVPTFHANQLQDRLLRSASSSWRVIEIP